MACQRFHHIEICRASDWCLYDGYIHCSWVQCNSFFHVTFASMTLQWAFVFIDEVLPLSNVIVQHDKVYVIYAL